MPGALRERRNRRGFQRRQNGKIVTVRPTTWNAPVRAGQGTRDAWQVLAELLSGRRRGATDPAVPADKRRAHVLSTAGGTALGASAAGLAASGLGLVSLPLALAFGATVVAVVGMRAGVASYAQIEQARAKRQRRRQGARQFLRLMGTEFRNGLRQQREQRQAGGEMGTRPGIRSKVGRALRRQLLKGFYKALPSSALMWQSRRWQRKVASWKDASKNSHTDLTELDAEQRRLAKRQKNLAREMKAYGGEPDLQLQSRFEEHQVEIAEWKEQIREWAKRDAALEKEHDRLRDRGSAFSAAGLKRVGSLDPSQMKRPKRMSAGQRAQLIGKQRQLNSLGLARSPRLNGAPASEWDLPGKVGSAVVAPVDELWDLLFEDWPALRPDLN